MPSCQRRETKILMRLNGYEEQNQPAQPKMTNLPKIQQNLQKDTCNTSVTAPNSSPPETATTKSDLYLLPAPLLKLTVWDLNLTKLWERHKTGEFCLFNPEPHPSPFRAYFWFTDKCSSCQFANRMAIKLVLASDQILAFQDGFC